MKKTWEKPVLVVLSRGRPEESMTQFCKSITMDGPAVGAVAPCQTDATPCATLCDS
jgi:hypothetical protein